MNIEEGAKALGSLKASNSAFSVAARELVRTTCNQPKVTSSN